MNKIHILPDDVISKIAAGEVIDRPASVLKELLENALDSGANSIEITLEDAGKTSMTIKDNGRGIGEGDLETIFKRHATSKIKCADDLFNIHSLGFRGEALYSIGAVCDVVLKSKPAEQDVAFEIHMRGGKTIGISPCSFSQTGTEIKIKEIFFNTPARKKFLKSNQSEIYQILNLFIPYTLLHPECRFSLTHQGKSLIDLSPTDNVLGRLSCALNIKEKNLLDNKFVDDVNRSFVHIILGDINIKRARRDMQFIFVNNRPVINKNISYHLNKIFRLIMPPESFGLFAVFLTIPPEHIDVNIHPSKREVQLKFENEICSVLRSMAESTMMKGSSIKQAKNILPSAQNLQSSISDALNKSSMFEEGLDGPATGYNSGFDSTMPREYAYPRTASFAQENNEHRGEFVPAETDLFEQKQNSLRYKLTNAKLIGSFINKYLIFESGRSLLFIDQHAAAERVTYEKLIAQMEKGTVEVQPLLSPIVMNISAQELSVWEVAQKNLEEIGFSTTQFDSQSIAIHSHPNLLKDPEQAIRHLLVAGSIDTSNHDSLARRACRSSIMTGDFLQIEKMKFIKEELLNCLDPYTCPHGRPTIIEFSEGALDKQFLRIK